MSDKAELKSKARTVLNRLEKAHPDARLYLEFDNAFELLIVTILAAQCKDETINKIRPALFGAFPDAPALSQAPDDKLKDIIKPSGAYNVKAKRIKQVSKTLVERFGGKVPDTLEGLLALPGVGRKTANIILGNAFGMQAISVDRHVQRVATRLGLSGQSQPDKIESDLCTVIPESRWTRATLLMGAHGRTVCAARKPECAVCTISKWCDYFAASARGMFR